MALRKTHDASAHLPEAGQGGKPKYVRVGTLYEDDTGKPVLKLDSLPADGRWQGWINFYTPDEGKVVKEGRRTDAIGDDDIPF